MQKYDWKTLKQIWEETPKDQFPVPLAYMYHEPTSSLGYDGGGYESNVFYLLGPAFPNCGFWLRHYSIRNTNKFKNLPGRIKENFNEPTIDFSEEKKFRLLDEQDSETIKKSLARFK